ncbi:hypothetical protein ACYFX5_19340 [Bremerella sp. T1]|uniref:hypothetical protein n=1 Tax=Bremerella sp. TYQ1 TaxID=3119568 RepID=UPI001CCDA0D1|nr:hypothetical protein [Bremerella volcania]UBM35201.1 hypothetical protein LA756_21290 [Bremerella volcania]
MSKNSAPLELWSDDVLRLPTPLISVYQKILQDIGRYEDACSESPSKLIGGEDEKSTQDHFAWRFAASVARTAFLMVDPNGQLVPVSTDLLTRLADGKIAVLEVPCGTGAGILGLLSTLAILRETKCVNSLPLEISVTAGDFSESARNLYSEMLSNCSEWLNLHAIRLSFETHHWDASEEPTTAQLVDSWFSATEGFEEYVVLISAFSGDAVHRFEEFDRSFQHIASRLYSRKGMVLWVEPSMNDARKYLKKAETLFQRFTRLFGFSPGLEGKFRWQHPFRELTPSGSIIVMKHQKLEVSLET